MNSTADTARVSCPFRKFVRLAGSLLCFALSTQPALASDSKDRLDEIEEDTQEGARVLGGKDLIVAPVPIVNPTLGTGIILGGVMFYNPNEAPSPWITGAAAMWSSNKNWLVGGFHSMSLNDDSIRIGAKAGAGKLVMDYYGIGPEAGDRNVSVKLIEKSAIANISGKVRVANNLYAGALYQFHRVRSHTNAPNEEYPDLEIPADQAHSTLSLIGPVVTFDSRDDSLNPRTGLYVNLELSFGLKGLGSDFNTREISGSVSYYRPLGPSTVLATHARICGVSAATPFYDLCLYGQKSDLRGYTSGRYRDRASWAMQAEIRQHISGRFGVVAFGGVGGTAPKLGKIGDTKFLPAAGAGVRFQPSRQTNINVRLDFAIGRDSNGIYVGIGEAF